MKSLLVLHDASAPSFCYYGSPEPKPGTKMSLEIFGGVLEYAAREKLALNIVCGVDGLDHDMKALIEAKEIPYFCYLPAAATNGYPQEIPVLEAHDSSGVDNLTTDTHASAVLRFSRQDMGELPGIWEKLARKVYRVVVVPTDIGKWNMDSIHLYEKTLSRLSDKLKAIYLSTGDPDIELNILSDRMVLSDGSPIECNAGLDHLTVMPDGTLSICPGFGLDGENVTGTLDSGPDIANKHLLSRDHAPICLGCDAHQCRRCVYINQRTTLEVNTGPWQQCRAAHLEREASRLLLIELKKNGLFPRQKLIKEIEYTDPLELVLNPQKFKEQEPPEAAAKKKNVKKRKKADTADVKKRPYVSEPPQSSKPVSKKIPMCKELPMANKAVAKVTPEERDTIRQLHLKKSGISELFSSLARLDADTLESSPLYDKLIADMGSVGLEFQAWWDKMAQNYNWPTEAGKKWRIDFDTCEIFLD